MLKIALAQINPTVGDLENNIVKIRDFALKAKKQGADLVLFPECAIVGYPAKDLLLKDSFIDENIDQLKSLLPLSKEIALVVGYIERNSENGKPLYNALALLNQGEIKHKQFKTLLPTYDVFDEDRYFESAKSRAPLEFKGYKLGFSICEDIWNYSELYPKPRYPIDPISELAKCGLDLLINISASPFSAGKERIRHELVRNQAVKHQIPVCYVNQVGGNDDLIFDGRSIVVNAQGKLIARGRAFQEDLIVFTLPDENRSFEIAESSDDLATNTYDALVLGTRDYVLKCGFSKAVIGLSGGIDSAVTAAIAVDALGAQNVLGIGMPSPYSSDGSITDARDLAQNLGIEFRTISISQPMHAFEEILKDHFKDKPADTTEENIQARIRGSILMSLSNKFGYLVLTTGNKSELAVGYCTLYGDMCGGLAVISDVPKMLVYELAKHINAKGKRTIIPISTIEKPPSAELRPDQTDQQSLPPYVILDGIIKAYVEDKLGIDDIVGLGYKKETVTDIINKIDRNEYKRKQAAPGLKVTAQAFGSGWRMPIAQRYKQKLLDPC